MQKPRCVLLVVANCRLHNYCMCCVFLLTDAMLCLFILRGDLEIHTFKSGIKNKMEQGKIG